MKPDQLRQTISVMEAYSTWEAALDLADETKAARPPKNADSPQWHRAEADHLDAQAAIVPATEKLKAEVITSDNNLAVPFRIGLLTALDRHIKIRTEQQADYLVDALNVDYRSSADLDFDKDFVWASRDPMTYAASIGNAIVEVEATLPMFNLRKTVPAAVLRVGNNHKGLGYKQPTDVDYYEIILPENRQICETPRLENLDYKTEKQKAVFKLPRLVVIESSYDVRTGKIIPKAGLSQPATTRTIAIPKLEMLEATTKHRSPTKLLIGKQATAFAKKHAKDIEKERRAYRASEDERVRLSQRRY